MDSELAVFGGPPIRWRPWPKWPTATAETQRCLLEVLHSGKWAISGWSAVTDTFERKISKAFAEYVGRKYCVACSSGSAALTIALQALDIGPGDEVILTGLTWVACPAAVSRLGARPVLVDIDVDNLCAPASAIEQAITPKTRAILMIHMYSSICDIAAYIDLAERHGLALLEDASQAHGASWRGAKIGSFGAVSVFSTQQSKLLTSGEGGLCVTDDPVLYARLQQLRADGRQYRADPFHSPVVRREVDQSYAATKQQAIAPDGYELEAAGDVAGQNHCLTEFQSALLLEGLQRLDDENTRRRASANVLAATLEATTGVELIVPAEDVDCPTFYRLAIRVDRSVFLGLSACQLVPAIAAELKADIRRVDAPLNAHPLYVPTKSPNAARSEIIQSALEPSNFTLPLAERAYAETVTLPHQMLLSAPEDMREVTLAFEKVRRCAPALKSRIDELTIHGDV